MFCLTPITCIFYQILLKPSLLTIIWQHLSLYVIFKICSGTTNWKAEVKFLLCTSSYLYVLCHLAFNFHCYFFCQYKFPFLWIPYLWKVFVYQQPQQLVLWNSVKDILTDNRTHTHISTFTQWHPQVLGMQIHGFSVQNSPLNPKHQSLPINCAIYLRKR